MKKVILPLAVIAMLAGACTKDSLSSVDSTVASSSHGADDGPGDDHGGGSGSGKGTRISSASVPSAVISAYKTRYPGATGAEWKKLDTGNYKVQFFRNGVRIEATFTPAGKLVKEERG